MCEIEVELNLGSIPGLCDSSLRWASVSGVLDDDCAPAVQQSQASSEKGAGIYLLAPSSSPTTTTVVAHHGIPRSILLVYK